MFDVKIFINKEGGNRLAGGYLTVANILKTNFTLLRTKSGGMFVSFPSYKKQNSEEWVNYVDTVSKEAREQVTQAIVDAYNRATGGYDRGEDQRVDRATTQYNNNPTTQTVSGQRSESIPSGVPF